MTLSSWEVFLASLEDFKLGLRRLRLIGKCIARAVQAPGAPAPSAARRGLPHTDTTLGVFSFKDTGVQSRSPGPGPTADACGTFKFKLTSQLSKTVRGLKRAQSQSA